MTENTRTTKTMVVTGATSGIGLATAEVLARQGVYVVGVGRSEERCRAAERRIRQHNPGARVDYLVADLSLQRDVRALAEQIRALVSASGAVWLDALVNNAGAFTYWLTLTAEGFETQWAVNHLAPFLLTNELLPLLQAAPAARVVNVSSGSHYTARLNWDDLQLRRHYNGLRAYGQSKLANVLFTLELNRLLGAGSPVRAFAADPGLVKTEIGFKGTPALVRRVWNLRRSRGITPEASAQGVAFLASEPSIQDSDDIYWRHAHPLPASRLALDRESAARLWAVSAHMCGISTTGGRGLAVRNPLVLITGASGGLGKAFAAECASRGWDLFLTDLDAGALETLSHGLRNAYQVHVTTLPCDLTDSAARAALYAHIRANGLRFWALVNVAGLDYEGLFYQKSRQQIQTIVRLNVESTLDVTHALLQYRDPLTPFRIINVASLAAFYPMPVKATYAASKRFLLDFSLALREEVRELGATVTALCPAGLPTTPECIRAIEAQGWMGILTTQNTGSVAAGALDAALQGRAVYIPGLINQAVHALGSLVPASLLAALIGRRWKSAHKNRRRQDRRAAGAELASLQRRE